MFLSHILFYKLARIKKELRIITRKFNLNIVRAVIEKNLWTGRRDPIDTSYVVSWETSLCSATEMHEHKGWEEMKKIIHLNTKRVYHLQINFKKMDWTNRRNYLAWHLFHSYYSSYKTICILRQQCCFKQLETLIFNLLSYGYFHFIKPN